jgi:hypothetical protein
MKLDSGMHIGMHLVFFGKSGVTSRLTSNTPEAVCSTSGTLAPAPVPAEAWTAEGLAGSGASDGVDAWAVVASAPADRVLAMWSWILPRGGHQTVGGNWARRWTATQQPPESSTPTPKGFRPKAPSEMGGKLYRSCYLR